MNIGLDFNGVIVDWGKLTCEGARELYSVDIPLEKSRKEMIVGEGYLTEEQYVELQLTLNRTREFGSRMEPLYGALYYISRLIEDGHKVIVVTSRSMPALAIAKEWSSERGLYLDFISVGYGVSKADAAQGLDLFVDDSLEKLKQLKGIVPHRYLFSWSYNAHEDEGEVAQRIGSWKGLYDTVRALGGIR